MRVRFTQHNMLKVFVLTIHIIYCSIDFSLNKYITEIIFLHAKKCSVV